MNIGSHLILGFNGTSLSADFLRLLQEEEIGGVILFARNVKSRDQVRELITSLKAARGGPLLVSVDHEGGRVFRLPEPFTPLPPVRAFGRYYEQTGDLQLIEAIAFSIAQELRTVGFNLNFAPVLDVDSCPDNPIIGDRAFHADPGIVSQVGSAFIRGFTQGGLLCCGKHFPGHGDTREDSHRTLPTVEQPIALLQQRELVPFRAAIAADVPCLMTAHVLYPSLDPEHCGTVSARINRELLRTELGFEGVLFSDDLLMKGIAPDSADVPEAALHSLQAGCDLLLVCHDAAIQQQTIARLKQKLEKSAALRAALSEAAVRVERLMAQVVKLERAAISGRGDTSELQKQLVRLSDIPSP